MSILYIIIGFILLIIGGDFLVRSSVSLSFKLNISKIVIGMTVVSFATSAPELLVSLQAALNGAPAIAINNVIGSNIANIGFVLGITAIIGSITVSKDFYKINWPVMMAFSILIYYFLQNDQLLSRTEGLILFFSLLIFLFFLIKHAKEENIHTDGEVNDALATVSYRKIFVWLIIGGLGLYIGSELLVNGAKTLATNMGISEAVISVTLIAIGTSVPELAASVIAALKGEKAISLGNLIGSNIFNIGSVLGLTAIVKEIPVTDSAILNNDVFWMLGFALILLPLVFIPKRMQISKYKGVLLFTGYVAFIYFVF